MRAGPFGRLREKYFADRMDEDPPPEGLQVIESSAKLGGGQASSFAHPDEGGGGLGVGDPRGSAPIGAAIGASRLLGSRLVDQQLDQGAGIAVEGQRRPSAT